MRNQLSIVVLIAGCTGAPGLPPSPTRPRTPAAVDATSLRLMAPGQTHMPRNLLRPTNDPPTSADPPTAADPSPTSAPAATVDPSPAAAPNPTVELDWNVAVEAPVEGTPALRIPSWPTRDNENDRFYAVVKVGTDWQLRAYYHLYNIVPDVCWQAPLDGEMNGFVALSEDGNRVYVATTEGTAFAVDNLETCPSPTATVSPAWVTALGAGVSTSGPWIDYPTKSVYLTDTAGQLHVLDETSGAERSGFPVTLGVGPNPSPVPIHSAPLVGNGNLWVGNDAGNLLRVDPATGAVRSAVSLCRHATCTATDAIYSSPVVDVGANALVLAVNGRLHQVDYGCSDTSCATVELDLESIEGVVWGAPTIDWQNGYVYVGWNNRLYKAQYPLVAGSSLTSQPVGSGAADVTYPRSSPLLWNNHVFVGDGDGYIERFDADGSVSLGAATVAPIDYGRSIDTAPIIDYAPSGNIYFGTRGGTDSAGSVVQITRLF